MRCRSVTGTVKQLRRLEGAGAGTLLAIILMGLASSSLRATEPPATPAVTRPASSLDELLEPVRARHQLPALAGAVIRGGTIVARGAVGVRAIGSPEPVTVDDLWHIGSCTKAFTATLIARLVEEGKLQWTTTIGETFPDLAKEIRPEYLDVTVEQLLRHRSGLPGDRRPDPAIRSQLRSFPGSIREQRRQAVRLVLQQEPAAPPGSTTTYANFGYVVAGAMAEQAGGAAWEELVRHYVFVPLGITSAGFGAPGVAGQVTQPRGHLRGEPVEPGPMADNAPVLGPAGTVHLSLADWAKFASLHLAGIRGESDFLHKETFARLYTPSPGDTIAIGWGVDEFPVLGRLYTHAGSNGKWFARVVLSPDRDLGILIAMNTSGPQAAQAADEVVVAVLRSFDQGS